MDLKELLVPEDLLTVNESSDWTASEDQAVEDQEGGAKSSGPPATGETGLSMQLLLTLSNTHRHTTAAGGRDWNWFL